MGSFTGAVASERVTEALKVRSAWMETMRQSVNAKASLTARMTVRAVTKVGVSDPAVCEWKCRRCSSHPGAEFGPKGFGCSPIKAVRELGSERRETVSVPYLSWA